MPVSNYLTTVTLSFRLQPTARHTAIPKREKQQIQFRREQGIGNHYPTENQQVPTGQEAITVQPLIQIKLLSIHPQHTLLQPTSPLSQYSVPITFTTALHV